MGVGVVVFWCVLSTIHVDPVLLSGMLGAGSEARCKRFTILHFIAEYCAGFGQAVPKRQVLCFLCWARAERRHVDGPVLCELASLPRAPGRALHGAWYHPLQRRSTFVRGRRPS